MPVSGQQTYPTGAQAAYPVPPAATSTVNNAVEFVTAWGATGATEVTETADFTGPTDLVSIGVL